MLKFIITGVSSKCREFRDKIQLRRTKTQMRNHSLRTSAAFIMSFGVSTQIETDGCACWHTIDNIPDRTLDIRVYIPSWYNRLREQIRLPWRISMRLSRCVLRRGWHITALMGFSTHVAKLTRWIIFFTFRHDMYKLLRMTNKRG